MNIQSKSTSTAVGVFITLNLTSINAHVTDALYNMHTYINNQWMQLASQIDTMLRRNGETNLNAACTGCMF